MLLVLCLGVIYLYMYEYALSKTYLRMYINCLVSIVQALLSLGSDGHV